jgi:hypothetical protein
MYIERNHYLEKLISCRHNGMIKVVTGVRRCGKSFLLFEIFTKWLSNNGVDNAHIIQIDLEDRRNSSLRDPDKLLAHIDSQIRDSKMHYILIDEVQLVDEFEDVLNSYLKMRNADVYVTGSNAKFLSKDVITTFRGRGFEIRVFPLTFREFFSAFQGTVQAAYYMYSLYGGLPQVLTLDTPELKSQYLRDLFTETYLKDIHQRHTLKHDEEMDALLNFISSSIGSLTNPNKLANTMNSVMQSQITRATVSTYLDYVCESFIVEKAVRYDLKGKRYFDTQAKYYFADMGLRNARLNFRQTEPSHIMENIIYNELRARDYNVDVGVVPVIRRNAAGEQQRAQLEVDFVCNQGSRRYYIQSAYRMIDDEKVKQEEASLRNVDDSFKKIIVVGDEVPILRSESGITTISIYDFLLRENALEL